jgi:hypothetical protein
MIVDGGAVLPLDLGGIPDVVHMPVGQEESVHGVSLVF